MSGKIVIIGDSGVGKTSIVRRYLMNINSSVPKIKDFDRVESTIGAAYYTIQLDQNKLQIWDTAGQERFRSICPIYFRGSSGCVCVFDVCNRNSFLNVDYWVRSFKECVSDKNHNILLLANKTDYPVDQWQLSLDEILSKACSLECHFILTSAIKMTNFDEFCKYIKTTYSEIPNSTTLNPSIDGDRSYCSSCL